MKSLLLRTTALLAVAVMACCGETEDSDPHETLDALVVVQTNLGQCARAHSYTVQVQRQCDASAVMVQVCSDAPLCDAQIDDLTSGVASCSATDDMFEASTSLTCLE